MPLQQITNHFTVALILRTTRRPRPCVPNEPHLVARRTEGDQIPLRVRRTHDLPSHPRYALSAGAFQVENVVARRALLSPVIVGALLAEAEGAVGATRRRLRAKSNRSKLDLMSKCSIGVQKNLRRRSRTKGSRCCKKFNSSTTF